MEMKIYKKEHGNRKRTFFKNYNPDEAIDVKKTAKSYGVSAAAVYKWIEEYKKKN